MVFSALTIAGSDSGGGAGIQADLKTFAAHRVHGLSVVTSLTAQNTSAVRDVLDVPAGFIESQFDAIHEDFNVGAAKTGMLSRKESIMVVSKKIGPYPLVVDPVMVSESGGRLLAEDAVDTLITRLLPKALVTTPNIFEAEILSGMKITGMADVKKACKRISELGCDVVIKGGHFNGTDVLYIEEGFHIFHGAKLDGSFHGSGCAFSAAIAANLAVGFDLVGSVSNAKEFIKGALRFAYPPGKGAVRAVNPMGVGFEDSFDDVLHSVRKAVVELENLVGLRYLTPEVGINLCYARRDASSLSEVAGVSGRIIRLGDRMRSVGRVDYGVSRHVARVILAAMGHDGNIRAAVNIKYRPAVIEAIEKSGKLSISSFNREAEPEKQSTMEWGTTEAIRQFGRVPDLIYDLGGVGKEPMIRILGRDPPDIMSKLKTVLGAVDGLG